MSLTGRLGTQQSQPGQMNLGNPSAKTTSSQFVPSTGAFQASARTRSVPYIAAFSGTLKPTSRLGNPSTKLGADLFFLGYGSRQNNRYVLTLAALQYVTTHARVTQAYEEIVLQTNPQARVTQAYEEVVLSATSKARLTLAYQEAVLSVTSKARVSQSYQEAVFTATSAARLTQAYIEVLIPDQKQRTVPGTARTQLTSKRTVAVTGAFSYTAPGTVSGIRRYVPLAGAISKYLGVARSLSPVALYLLDEATGTVAKDSAGSNDGTYTGSNTQGASGPSTDLPKALTFGGTNGYVSVPLGSVNWSAAGITWAGWVNPTSAASWARFLDLGNGAPSNNIVIARNGTSNTLDVEVFNGTSTTDVQFANVLAPNQGWFYLAVSITPGGLVTAYKDGLPLGTGQSGAIQNVTRANNYLGRSYSASDSYYAGKQAGVFIVNRVLSYSEILQLTRAAVGDQNGRVTEAYIEVISTPPTPTVRATEAWVEAVVPAQANPRVRATEAWIEVIAPSQPNTVARVTEAWIEVIAPPMPAVVHATGAWIEVLGKEQSARVIAVTAQLGLRSTVPTTAAIKQFDRKRTVTAIGAVGISIYVTQDYAEVLAQYSPNAVVTQDYVEALANYNATARTTLVYAEVLARLQSIRQVLTSGVFRTTGSRSAPLTASFDELFARAVPTSGSFVVLITTYSRTVPATAALELSSTRTVAVTGAFITRRKVPTSTIFNIVGARRTVPATRILANRLFRTVPTTVGIGTREHAVPALAQLFGSQVIRSVPTRASLDQRRIPLSGAFSGAARGRVVPTMAYLSNDRYIAVSVTFTGDILRFVPVSRVLARVRKRLVPAVAAIDPKNNRPVPVTASLVKGSYSRTVPLSASLVLQRYDRTVPASGAFQRTYNGNSGFQPRVVPLLGSIGLRSEVPTDARIKYFDIKRTVPVSAIFYDGRPGVHVTQELLEVLYIPQSTADVTQFTIEVINVLPIGLPSIQGHLNG